jgi:hypothetical protein
LTSIEAGERGLKALQPASSQDMVEGKMQSVRNRAYSFPIWIGWCSNLSSAFSAAHRPPSRCMPSAPGADVTESFPSTKARYAPDTPSESAVSAESGGLRVGLEKDGAGSQVRRTYAFPAVPSLRSPLPFF